MQETSEDKHMEARKEEADDPQELQALPLHDQEVLLQKQQPQPQQQQQQQQPQLERQMSSDSAEEGFQASLSALMYLLTNHEDKRAAVAAALNAVLSVPRRQVSHPADICFPKLTADHAFLLDTRVAHTLACACMRMCSCCNIILAATSPCFKWDWLECSKTHGVIRRCMLRPRLRLRLSSITGVTTYSREILCMCRLQPSLLSPR